MVSWRGRCVCGGWGGREGVEGGLNPYILALVTRTFTSLGNKTPASDWCTSLLPFIIKVLPTVVAIQYFTTFPQSHALLYPTPRLSTPPTPQGHLSTALMTSAPQEVQRSVSVPIFLDLTAAFRSLFERPSSLGRQNATLSPFPSASS